MLGLKFFYSHSGEGLSEVFAKLLLERNAIDNRSKRDLNLVVYSLNLNETMEINASYEERQSLFLDENQKDILSNIGFNRAYGCREMHPQSNINFGACLGANDHSFIWLTAWPQRSTGFADQLEKFLKWLEKDVPLQDIFFDLRGNGGGSPESVADTLCMIGDDIILNKMADFKYETRYIPEFFQLDSSLLPSSSLRFAHNLSIRRSLPGLIAKINDKDQKLHFNVDFFQRTLTDKSNCQFRRMNRQKSLRWSILTNGREFSSTEEFLFLVKGHPQFQIYGKTSVGGGGSPWWIELPNTGTSIRLSPSRNVYRGEKVIEGKGVQPTFYIDHWEGIKEFEERLVSVTPGYSELSRTDLPPPSVVKDLIEVRKNEMKKGEF